MHVHIKAGSGHAKDTDAYKFFRGALCGSELPATGLFGAERVFGDITKGTPALLSPPQSPQFAPPSLLQVLPAALIASLLPYICLCSP